MLDFPVPEYDTGIGVHDDADVYWQPWGQWDTFARELWGHGIRWYLLFVADENKVGFARALINAGIMPIVRFWPAKMPNLNIDPAHIDAYLEAGVKWFVIGNEFNLNEEWTTVRPSDDAEKCAQQYLRYASEIRAKGGWPLTPPPSLGGHINHRVWFRRFMDEIQRQGDVLDALYPGGIGLHCRSIGNPLDAGPEDYDCSAREWEWFDKVIMEYVGQPLPMANLEAFDEPNWSKRLNPEFSDAQKWEWWYQRNREQMNWFNPDNPSYTYPLRVMCNCFWLIHDGGTWADCGLQRNFFYGMETGDGEVPKLYRDMPFFVQWERREVEPPPPNGNGGEEPSEVEWINVDESMREYLMVVPYDGEEDTYWQVAEVEYYPDWDSTTCFGQLEIDGVLVTGSTIVSWPDGYEYKEVKTDPYRPDGIASDHPMWRSMAESAYLLEATSHVAATEGLFGIGLAAPGEPWRPLHRPLRVRFRLVTVTEPPPPPPVNYTLLKGMEAKGLTVIDDRKELEEEYFDLDTIKRRGLGPEDLQSITLHHDVITTPLDVGAIAKYHTDPKPEGRGWSAISYHFIIDTDGTVHFTKKLVYWGAQSGYKWTNMKGIAVALHGDFENQRPPDVQIEAFSKLVDALREFVGGGWDAWYPLAIMGHKHIVDTVCPGKAWDAYLQLLEV